MIVSIHQPQYLPWLPYLTKIESSDLFIFLNTVDFQKNGLQNRNQIKTANGASWLTIPVQQHLGQKINEVKIDNKTNWRRKHWLTIQQCYRKAPFFDIYQEEIENFFSLEWESLSDLNIELTKKMLSWLGIKTNTMLSSNMKSEGKASELILNLCLEVEANSYLSGIGGKNYLNEDSFNNSGIDIIYLPSILPDNYPQLFPIPGFIRSLSAIDIIFNCGDKWRNFMPAKKI